MRKILFLILFLFVAQSLPAQRLVRTRNEVSDSLKAPVADGHGGYSWQTVSGGGGNDTTFGIGSKMYFQGANDYDAGKWFASSSGVTNTDPTDKANQNMSYAYLIGGAGTLSRLQLSVDVAAGEGFSDTLFIWKNGAQTSLVAVASGDEVYGIDNVNTVSVDSGDLIAFRFGGNGGFNTSTSAATVEFNYNGILLDENFSGVSSGTNTGDQDLSGYMTKAWIATDSTAPVQTPTVTTDTKGIAFGDSAYTDSYGAKAFGRRSHATAVDADVFGSGSVASGWKSGAWGKSSTAQSVGSQCFGGAFDACTSQVDDGTHGHNYLMGDASSTTNSTDDMNLAFGYNCNVGGDGNVSLGANNYNNGSNAGYGLFLGYGIGLFNAADAKYITILGAYGSIAASYTSANLPHSTFDTVTFIGANTKALYAKNAFSYYLGSANDTTVSTSGDLFVIGNGGKYGNATRSNALLVERNGTVFAGKNFASTLRTITNANDSGVAGEICYDANYIYICTATNTWKRVAIATWP